MENFVGSPHLATLAEELAQMPSKEKFERTLSGLSLIDSLALDLFASKQATLYKSSSPWLRMPSTANNARIACAFDAIDKALAGGAHAPRLLDWLEREVCAIFVDHARVCVRNPAHLGDLYRAVVRTVKRERFDALFDIDEQWASFLRIFHQTGLGLDHEPSALRQQTVQLNPKDVVPAMSAAPEPMPGTFEIAEATYNILHSNTWDLDNELDWAMDMRAHIARSVFVNPVVGALMKIAARLSELSFVDPRALKSSKRSAAGPQHDPMPGPAAPPPLIVADPDSPFTALCIALDVSGVRIASSTTEGAIAAAFKQSKVKKTHEHVNLALRCLSSRLAIESFLFWLVEAGINLPTAYAISLVLSDERKFDANLLREAEIMLAEPLRIQTDRENAIRRQKEERENAIRRRKEEDYLESTGWY